MSLYLKPVLVLVVSILVFAGAAYLADVELLDYVSTHFYNPSVVKSTIRENQKDAELIQNHIYELRDQFALVLNEPAVRGSFLYNQNADDVYERSRIFGILMETVSGLQSVQFIDSNGVRIHYSNSARDIINQSSESTAYRNYAGDLPYDRVSVPAYGNAKFTMDGYSECIIFSFPFYDSMDVYRGTALFSLSARALAEILTVEGRLKANDDVSVIGIPAGVVFGSPDASKTDILGKVSLIWNNGFQDHITLDSQDSGVKYALISTKTDQDLFFGRLINNSIFSIPNSMKLVLQLSMFLTLYLILFLLVNFKPHPVTLVKNRIKNLRANLFEQLYVNKSAQERTKWILELEQRRDEIRRELKYNLKMRPRLEKKIDAIIDNSWDELLAVIESGSDRPSAVSLPSVVMKGEAVVNEMEELEELEEIEEAEELGEAEEIEEAEELEELEEIEEAEELGEAEEIEEAEELDELEEIEEIEEVEEFGGIDILGDIEDIEEVEELEEIEEPESSTADTRKRFIILTNRGGVNQYENIEPKKYEIPEHLHNGLVEMASEIEFGRNYPAGAEDGAEDLNTELNIVSPFSSMFSSLDEEKNDPEEP